MSLRCGTHIGLEVRGDVLGSGRNCLRKSTGAGATCRVGGTMALEGEKRITSHFIMLSFKRP